MRFLIALFLLAIPSPCNAQVNMESERGGDKKGWGYSTEFGFTLQGGNVDTFSYKLGLRGDLVTEKDHYFISLSNQYGEEGGQSFRDQGFAHLRWTHMEGFLGFEVYTQVEYDDFKLLQVRQLNGLGARAEFLKVLALGVSAMSDYEALRDVEEGSLDWRASSYLSLSNKIGESVLVRVVGYYQPLFRDLTDYRIFSVASIALAVSKYFSVKTEFTYAFDTLPPEGVDKEDAQLLIVFQAKGWTE
jgi:hypothetical protein